MRKINFFLISTLLALKECFGNHVIDIGGIFPIGGKGGWQGGQACQPAAELALQDVNRDKSVLAGYTLTMHSNDSECDPGLAQLIMYDLIYNDPTKLMLMAGCSTVCTNIAALAQLWNLVVVCYGASSPALSDRKRFTTLFRTHPSATVHNPTRLKLFLEYEWSQIAIIQQTEEVFMSTVQDLEQRCKDNNIEVITRQSFSENPADAVRNLKRHDARIIVGLFYAPYARKVLCEMYKNQLYGKSYVWFFIGWYEDDWFKPNETNIEKEGLGCTREQLIEAAEGHFTTEALMWNRNVNEKTISGMTANDFAERLNRVLKGSGYDIDHNRYPEGYQEAPLAYDAVWAVALALDNAMKKLRKFGKNLEDFEYTNEGMAREIYSAMNTTEFLGISGTVAFSWQGDRIALTQIEQVQNNSYVKLAYYDTESDNLTWLNKVQWIDNKIPQDRTIVKVELRTLNVYLLVSIWILAVVGILTAVGLILFTIFYHHRRVIQYSHPACNIIILVGIIVCMIGVILLGLDGQLIPPEKYHLVCQGRIWIMYTGFTLTMGTMFSKIWRVHRLTTKRNLNFMKNPVQPWKLYTMVASQLVIDLAILLVWQIYDPLQRKLQEFTLEDPANAEQDIKILPFLEHCESQEQVTWITITLCYKGIILAFSLFLAYETSNYKIKQINDSRYVAMCIYNVVLIFIIMVPVALLISAQHDASFVFVTFSILYLSFLSMALIYVPKIIEIYRNPVDKPEAKFSSDYGNGADYNYIKKLCKENEELLKMIRAKESALVMMKLELAQRRSLQDGGKGSMMDASKFLRVTTAADGFPKNNNDKDKETAFIASDFTSDSAYVSDVTEFSTVTKCTPPHDDEEGEEGGL